MSTVSIKKAKAKEQIVWAYKNVPNMLKLCFLLRVKNMKSLVGLTFGDLLVKNSAPSNKDGRHWECHCICGNTVIKSTKVLNSGNTKSCGCLLTRMLIARNTTHSHTGTRIYKSWMSMNSRCNNPNNKRYMDYGGRGITVCESWKNFTVFLKDMGEMPAVKTLERKDVNKAYSPENCIWATYKEQNSNRRDNVFVKLASGIQVTLMEASRILNVPRTTLTRRLDSGNYSEACYV